MKYRPEIIGKMLEVLKTTRLSDLARDLGVTPQSIQGWKRDRIIPGDRVINFALKHEVDLRWLVRGTRAGLVSMVREEDPEYGSYINVPILADPIAAGPPREVAEGDYTETVRVPIRFWRGGSYAMRVRGESMKPTFNEGDLVGISIFRGDPKALEGKIVAAWIVDEGLTVKQLRLVKGGGLLLQPLNPGSPPLYIGPQDVETVRLFRVDWWLGHQE